MSVRIDEALPSHPKILKAGPEAAWLFVCGLCYCSQHATDGIIPLAALAKLSDSRRPRDLAKKLVASKLWEDHPDGYRVHDYTDWNPSAEQVKAKRAASSERVRRWRDRHYGNATAPPLETPLRNALPTPPSSVPFRSVTPSAGDARAPAPSEPEVTGVQITPGLLHRMGEVYEESVRIATGKPYGLNPLGRKDLAAIVNAHVPRTSIADAIAWLEKTIAAWVTSCGDNAIAHGGYRPNRLLDWLNAGAPATWTSTRQGGLRDANATSTSSRSAAYDAWKDDEPEAPHGS